MGLRSSAKREFTLERAVSGTMVAAASNASLHIEHTVLIHSKSAPTAGVGLKANKLTPGSLLRAGLPTRVPGGNVTDGSALGFSRKG